MMTTAGALARDLAAQYGDQEYEVLAWLAVVISEHTLIDAEHQGQARAAYAADHHRIEVERS